MSRDQRPGRVKVYAGGGAQPHPLRRHDDPKPEPAVEIAPPPQPALRLNLIQIALFLAACALGGAATSLLRLFLRA